MLLFQPSICFYSCWQNGIVHARLEDTKHKTTLFEIMHLFTRKIIFIGEA